MYEKKSKKQRSTNKKKKKNNRKMKDNKKLKTLGNALEQILGFSNYCNMTCKQKRKTNINKEKP